MSWLPRSAEIPIPYHAQEYDRYWRGDKASKYSRVAWRRRIGRSRHGEFPLVVAREYFRQLGYTVWAAEPELPDPEGFMVVSFSGKRRRGHPAYRRMELFFGASTLAALNATADAAKRAATGNVAGGDPDLFVSRGTERFFVEVKWRDQITAKQRITFPLIERYCKVHIKIARLSPTADNRMRPNNSLEPTRDRRAKMVAGLADVATTRS